MSDYLFPIGSVVSLDFHERQSFSKLNPFTVEALMPPVGDTLQYRVKSPSEPCRRVVAEHQISLVAPVQPHE